MLFAYLWVASSSIDLLKALEGLSLASVGYVDNKLSSHVDLNEPDGVLFNISAGGDSYCIVYNASGPNKVNMTHVVKVEGGEVMVCEVGGGCQKAVVNSAWKDKYRRKDDLSFNNGSVKGQLALAEEVAGIGERLEEKMEEMRKEVIGDPICGLPVDSPNVIYRPGVVVNGTATVGGAEVNFSLTNNNTFSAGGEDYFIRVDGGKVVVCPTDGGECLPAKGVVVFSYDGKYATKQYVDSAISNIEGGLVERVKVSGTFVEVETFDDNVTTVLSRVLAEDEAIKNTISDAIDTVVSGNMDLATKADIYEKDADGKYTTNAKYVTTSDYTNDKVTFFTTKDYTFIKNPEGHTPGDSTIYSGKAIKAILDELDNYVV